MWSVSNLTPFADEHTWVRDRDGAEVWLIAVRGTFLINPDGSTSVATKQDAACLTPRYRAQPGESSLLYDTDLPHLKPTTDVILHGHAYSPEGRAATRLSVSMKVADLEKTLCVFGDRVWEKRILGLGLSSPQPFEKMPLTYERAYGGGDRKAGDPRMRIWDERNPVGTGFALEPEGLKGVQAPNIEDVRALISSWDQRPRPSGFGPIAPHWLPRRKWGGTYDERWQKERLPLLPDDFDDRFYQCAPEDQQISLIGGEPVELRNLTPGGLLRFTLPRVVLGFETYFSTGERIVHHANLHTVILEPDVPRVLLVWHTHLPCHPKVLKLERTLIWQKRSLIHPLATGARDDSW